LQTGEYRWFAGQFSVWMCDQVAVWRGPLLLSLTLHAVLFWPRAMQDSDLGASTVAVSATMQAHLRPSQAAEPPGPRVHDAPVRHATVTQASPGRRRMSPAVQDSGDLAAAVPIPVPTSVLQPTAGLDAGAVRIYRLALSRVLAASALREHLTAGMQGRVEVGVAISVTGQVRDIAVLQGSGIAALDNAVVAALRGAVSGAPIPSAMQGREFVLAVPVEVGLVAPTPAADR
jgi:TonB family protein